MIQIDEICVIFWHLQVKLLQFSDYSAAAHCAGNQKFFGFRSNENARFIAFPILWCCQKSKKSDYLSRQSIGKNLTNMVAMIDIDALKIYEQMKLKIEKINSQLQQVYLTVVRCSLD